jgi:signal peptidase I
MRKNRLQVKARRLWRRHIRPIAVIVLVMLTFRSAVADWNDVPSGSMQPSILIGDRIFVNKLAYGLRVPFTSFSLIRWDTPQRGEVVVFSSPKDGTRLVKRVVGIPGDIVALRDNEVIINGKPLSYGALSRATIDALPAAERDAHGYATETLGQTRHPVMNTPAIHAMRDYGPIQVPPGEYFMLGDNRDNSADSRYIGTVPLSNILGRTSAVAMSLDYQHYFLPRWNRFFKSLNPQ